MLDEYFLVTADQQVYQAKMSELCDCDSKIDLQAAKLQSSKLK